VVPFFSTVEGRLLDASELDAGYWYRNLRRTVRFESVVAELAGQGFGVFVEVSSHPVLAMSVQETLEDRERSAVVAGSLRRDEGGLDRFLASVAEVWTQGVAVDWGQVFAGAGASRVELPTYAFQRRRYWLRVDPAAASDMNAIGLLPTTHPLLGAAIDLPESGEVLFTGRLSTRTQPWLPQLSAGADGAALVPAAAFVELAVRAGDEVGCDVLEELTLDTPLVLPEDGAVHLRVRVGAPDESGRRTLAVHTRPEHADTLDPAVWTRHATGALVTGAALPAWDLAAWPPADAAANPVEGAPFPVWRTADEVFAEVALPAEWQAEAARFGLHPALLDAVLETARFAEFAASGDSADRTGPDTGSTLWLPSVWRGMALYAAGADTLRVRIAGAGPDSVTVGLADATGAAVAHVDALTLTRRDVADLVAESGAEVAGGAGTVLAVRRLPARRTAAAGGVSGGRHGGQSLTSRLAGLPDAERTVLLTEVVRHETAAVLGHASPDTVELGRGFFEQGFNSLMSVDLRNRLSAATGLRLPTAFLFEYTMPSAVISYLRAELAGTDGTGTASGTATGSGTDGAAPGGVTALYRQAFAEGRHTAGNELIMAASTLRATFGSSTAEDHVPDAVRLSAGGAGPRLFCLPAVVATAGPQQYTRFAEYFRDRRDVTVLPQPGFLRGELLPADIDALAELHVRAVHRTAGTEPFVLVGHSAGGQIAHAVSSRLERLGTPPAALVLLDVPWPDDEADESVAAAMLGVVFDREAKLGGDIMNDTRVTAMGGYHRILDAWQPEPIETPTLLVRATESMPTASGAPEDGAMLHVTWKLGHTVRDVPGNHFTIIEECAGSTARVVEEWLNEIL
ncbi:alpha/beta fold hydrolase, partial [Streptomyces sp. NPDC101151]|uniref:alpha/beta fold hydrolase n=1 Tax=Streptomyces sp. NPDC101151 TaxID=3366115 RepID=UPI003803A177